MKKDYLATLFCAICAVSCVACILYCENMQSAYAIKEEEALKQFAEMNENTNYGATAREQLLDTLTVAQTMEADTAAEETKAPADDAGKAEETTEVLRVPVVLAEDGSFWYDQDGEGLTLEAAEEYLSEHEGYCQHILDLNENQHYLSDWQNSGRTDILEYLRKTMMSGHGENTCIAMDQSCKVVAKSVIGGKVNRENLPKILGRFQDGNLAADYISELILLDRNQKGFVDGYAVEYIFWSTMAQLVHDEVYSVKGINRDLEPQKRVSLPSNRDTSSKDSAQASEKGGPTVAPEEPPKDGLSAHYHAESGITNKTEVQGSDEVLGKPVESKAK